MTLPAITLMSGVQTEIDPDICFTLDSSELGVLDTDILAGTEDTEFVAPIQSITIQRGRSRQFDRFVSGTATILFDNRDRKLDPLNDDSPYKDFIAPRLRFKVLADNIPIYAGFATDWNVEYDKTYNDSASVACADSFTVLANFVISRDELPQSELPGDRLDWLVTVYGYNSPTNFASGNYFVGAQMVTEGTILLDYMFQVAQSDRGNLFVDSAGVVQYVGQFDREAVSEVTFADDGSGIPYMSLEANYDDELLYNEVIVTSPAGTVVSTDENSVASFGLSSLNLPNLLNAFESDLRLISQEIVEKYSFPKVRFTGLSVELAGLSAAQVEDILNLELADQVSVLKSFQSGSPLSVTQDLMVSGIRHRIQPGSHVVEFSFEPTPYKDSLILDDPVRGTIDDDNYLF